MWTKPCCVEKHNWNLRDTIRSLRVIIVLWKKEKKGKLTDWTAHFFAKLFSKEGNKAGFDIELLKYLKKNDFTTLSTKKLAESSMLWFHNEVYFRYAYNDFQCLLIPRRLLRYSEQNIIYFRSLFKWQEKEAILFPLPSLDCSWLQHKIFDYRKSHLS